MAVKVWNFFKASLFDFKKIDPSKMTLTICDNHEPLNDEIFIDSRKFMWIKFLILFAHCWFYLGNLSLSRLPLKHSTQVSNIQANFNNRKNLS